MNGWIRTSLLAGYTLTATVLTAKQPAPQVQSAPSDIMGIYFGGFGGWIFPYSVSASQKGTAFFNDSSGGPLDVNAIGSMHGRIKGFGGLHIGYEWMNNISPGFRLAPALELEGIYFANTTKKAHLINLTTRIPEHNFLNRLPMRIGTLLANGILEFNNDYLSPYIGVGVGVGFVWIHDATSLQVSPKEAGINHYNSDPNAFDSLFATQAKAGLRYRFFKHYRLSAEYRFTYLTSSAFLFGSTRYPTHVPTSPWWVKLGGLAYSGMTFGIDFIF